MIIIIMVIEYQAKKKRKWKYNELNKLISCAKLRETSLLHVIIETKTCYTAGGNKTIHRSTALTCKLFHVFLHFFQTQTKFQPQNTAEIPVRAV